MLQVFQHVKKYVRVKFTKVRVDNAIFRLHYQVTFVALLVCCLLVTSRQFIGDHINCIQEPPGSMVPPKIINSFCYFMSTFTLPRYMDGKAKIGIQIPYVGIGPPVDENEPKKYHAYYQWVPFVLFFQALSFYAPWMLWKTLEGGKIRNIMQGLNIFNVKAQERKKKRKILVEYIIKTLHYHNFWAIKFFLCEVFNIIVVVLNMVATNAFLGGEFWNYGRRVIEFTDHDQQDRIDPMILVFPRMTKCSFEKYGPSGSVQIVDAYCMLALNIINEKIYVFMWFWFIILLIVTFIGLVYRVLTFIFPALRAVVLRAISGANKRRDVDVVVHKCQIGDYLLLYFLGKNMDRMVYREFFQDLASALSIGSSAAPTDSDTSNNKSADSKTLIA